MFITKNDLEVLTISARTVLAKKLYKFACSIMRKNAKPKFEQFQTPLRKTFLSNLKPDTTHNSNKVQTRNQVLLYHSVKQAWFNQCKSQLTFHLKSPMELRHLSRSKLVSSWLQIEFKSTNKLLHN
jgi:hypothetical protein